MGQSESKPKSTASKQASKQENPDKITNNNNDSDFLGVENEHEEPLERMVRRMTQTKKEEMSNIEESFDEGELQLQALSTVCLSYLDHLELIVASRNNSSSSIQTQTPIEIFKSLKDNVQTARIQLDKFFENLQTPYLHKVFISSDSNDDFDLFEDRDLNYYGWTNKNIKRIGFDYTHNNKIYDIDIATQMSDPVICVSCAHDAKLVIWKMENKGKSLGLRITDHAIFKKMTKQTTKRGVDSLQKQQTLDYDNDDGDGNGNNNDDDDGDGDDNDDDDTEQQLALSSKSYSLKFEKICMYQKKKTIFIYLYFFNLKKKKKKKKDTISLSSSWVTTTAIHPFAKYVACGGLENTVSVFDIQELISQMIEPSSSPLSSSSSQKKKQKKVKKKSGQNISIPKALLKLWNGYISQVRFLNDDKHLLVSSGDCTCSLINHKSKTIIHSFIADGDVLSCDFAFVNDSVRKRGRARVRGDDSNASLTIDEFALSASAINSNSINSYPDIIEENKEDQKLKKENSISTYNNNNNNNNNNNDNLIPTKRMLIAIGVCDVEDTILIADIQLAGDQIFPTFNTVMTEKKKKQINSLEISEKNNLDDDDLDDDDDDDDDISIVQKMKLAGRDVHSVCFSPSGEFLAVGGDASIYRIYQKNEEIETGRFVFKMIHERFVNSSICQMTWVNDYTLAVCDDNKQNQTHSLNTIYITYWLQDTDIRRVLLKPYLELKEKIPLIILGYIGLDIIDTHISCSLTDKLSCLASLHHFKTAHSQVTNKQSKCQGLLIAGSWNNELEGFVNKASK